MTLRTPRRRISPRTKRRYRAIKDFLRRTLGTSSQPGTKTNSSIEVSVSDLKSKIIGIEQELNKVSRHCRDLTCLEHSFRKDSVSSSAHLPRDEGTSGRTENFANLKDVETKLLYKSSNNEIRKSAERNNIINFDRHDDRNDMTPTNHSIDKKNSELREKTRENNDLKISEDRRRTQPKHKNRTIPPIYSTSSFHSLLASGNKNYSNPRNEKRHLRDDYTEPLNIKEHRERETTKKDFKSHERYDERHNKSKRTKRRYSELDKEFISDIIRRQYKPVKLFGRKDSDFSQFSAPVCRDQEFTVRQEIQEDSELCSCCFDERRQKRHYYCRNSDLSDMRSVCDTRLYSSKKNRRYRFYRECTDDYNDSALYDIVPVKEKSSPKSRRKFVEDNMIAYQYSKEVPPSPRSHRPRLNLRAQHYTDYDDSVLHGRYENQKKSPARESHKKVTNMIESDASYVSNPQKTQLGVLNNSKRDKPTQIQEDVGTMSSLQYSNFINEQTNISNNDTTLNTQITESIAEKTDKTLCEIKDILQNFLLEIKKESTHSEKSGVTNKLENNQLSQHHQSTKISANIQPNSGHSFNGNYNIGQCSMPPFMPSFPNPGCYPIFPMCPMNCLQNGYIIPSPSYTCTMCAKNSKEPSSADKESCFNKNKTSEETNTNNETQELIKEIYKFVSQKPISPRTKNYGNENNSVNSNNEQRTFHKKLLTSRSAGGSTKESKHDANVGTANMKCHSKSCEAIGSRIISDIYNTNASYSDTILEKLSLEATQSSSDTDLSTEVPEDKVKRCRFKKVLRSLGLFKKKKNKDVIEEMSESESTIDVEVKPKPPFKQHLTTYAMHGQEYFHPPPMPRHQCCRSPPPDFYGHAYDPRNSCPHPPPPPGFYNHHKHHHYEHDHSTSPPRYNPRKLATASPYPNYDAHYGQMPPQVPLCLKEIEVKSIGTQSVRKMSILQKLTTKVQPPVNEQSAQCHAPPAKEKPSFWQTLQEKAKQSRNDPMDFTLKTQKQLAQGDMKMRNAMLKKMFYKRNPFSPRNLIVRTLLGKDRSSYGEPPKMYQPRMFL